MDVGFVTAVRASETLPMMKRVVGTSRGPLVFEFTGRKWATVEAFDFDGWRTGSFPWKTTEPGAAEQAVEQVTTLPPDEVQRVVADTLGQYEKRGGEEAAKDPLFGRRRT